MPTAHEELGSQRACQDRPSGGTDPWNHPQAQRWELEKQDKIVGKKSSVRSHPQPLDLTAALAELMARFLQKQRLSRWFDLPYK